MASAPVEGKVFGIFGANGWTGMLTAIAGGLLLFGAAQHLLAKTMSLIVGVALGAAAVIALISGDVLGLAAANRMTELAWGIAAAILLVNTLVPRRRRRVTTVADDAAAEPYEPGSCPAPAGARPPSASRPTTTRPTSCTTTSPPPSASRPTTTRPTSCTTTSPRPSASRQQIEDTAVTHDHEATPFSPDDQETRVTADREDDR